MIPWLIGAGLGPAAVAVPVNWAGAALADVAQRWFRRLRRTDDLSRLVRAATSTSVGLTQAEFDAVRRLLEDQQTWALAGRGTVEDLAHRIASCLPPRDGRTGEDSHAAALTIARGLLEFAVADLDPKVFQQVLLTRLQRMETDQASALDEALLDLHVDLIARLAAQGELDAQRFTSVMGHLKRVLDRLPPGPAHRGEIVAYLGTLTDWLNTDPWPRDRRFGGPVLTPAAIERKLRATATGSAEKEQDLDADVLAEQCQRLVILGGPGSGKTWLAKRTARRCAEHVLNALAAGGTLDEVELPLYTTCSRLFSADGDIRQAAVASALDQLADLGGSRLSSALRVFFTERNAPTLLVIDALDEAHGSDERLRQADTLPWRIVLTSRPGAWNHQLAIKKENDSHQVGELQPLRYPDDIEPFIHRWFTQQPEWGNDLASQIARRPGLQQAATVPLILAFYCIVGGREPLPEFRRDLYTRVLKRMLTGRWRCGDDSQPDPGTCLQALRAWAWSGATSHPVSGLGTWADDIPTERGRLGEASDKALDHVATPLGPPDVDTGKTLRRFIHRSIREHLVAEYVASLPLDQAAEALLPHIWYDPDWDYAAPAALAMHPQRNQLLLDLICRAARSKHIPRNLSVIDGGWEVRRLLARVAAESHETDWLPEAAKMIGQARLDLATSRQDDLRQVVASDWPTSNGQITQSLLGLLARAADPRVAGVLAKAVTGLELTEQDRAQARERLLELLARATGYWDARHLTEAVAGLTAAAQDRDQVRPRLLGLLGRAADPYVARVLAEAVAGPELTEQDRAQARERLLELLARAADPEAAGVLAKAVTGLTATAQDRDQVRPRLLELLGRATHPYVAAVLAQAVTGLELTEQDRAQAGQRLLELLARAADPRVAGVLAKAVTGLELTEQDRAQARERLLELLARATGYWDARHLTEAVAGLTAAAQDRDQVRPRLLGLLARAADPYVARVLAEAVARLEPTVADLDACHGWVIPPSSELLAIVRRNSKLLAWLAALPLFSRSASTATE